MHKPLLDIHSRAFGLLRATQEEPRKNGRRRWLCVCKCGKMVSVDQGNLTSGHIKSCGCIAGTHRGSKMKEYRHWVNMISRCENRNGPWWEHYGGRGIIVCDRWRDSFVNFFSDVGPKPGVGYSIDRIDVNGNYSPENVRWATATTQTRNTRVNRMVGLNGTQMTLAEAVERLGLKYNTVLYRLLRGKTVEEALR